MVFLILGIVMPLLFLVYNIVYYLKKKVIYTIKKKSFIIVNDNFFNIQLNLSCINCIFMFVIAYLWETLNLELGYVFYIVIFWTINYLIKGISISKKYAKVEQFVQ